MYRNKKKKKVTNVQVFIKQRHLGRKTSGLSLVDSWFVGSSYINQCNFHLYKCH